MIGDNIKRFREERGWTQEELALKMGYSSKSTINKIEKNINDISQTKIEKFAQVFDCDPTELITSKSATSVSRDLDRERKADELYSRYEKLSPDDQKMFLMLLDKIQPR